MDDARKRKFDAVVVWRFDLAQERVHTAAEPVKAVSSRDEDSLESPSTQRRLSPELF